MKFSRVLLAVVCLGSGFAAVREPADAVDPLIGTTAEGQTFPATGVPFGMTNWTPQTRDGQTKCIAPYYFEDKKIQGFRGSHFLSGSCTQDYGSFTLTPGSGPLPATAAGRGSAFRRETEKATPYRYDVVLEEAGIAVSMSATARAGIVRFVFQKGAPAWVVLQSNARTGEGGVEVDAARREVSGFNPAHRLYAGSGKPAGFSGYFVARFDHAFTVRKKDALSAAVGFETKPGEAVVVKVGTSFVSVDEARKNLDAEIPGWDVDRVAAAAKQAWNTALAAIDVEAASEGRRRVFYTALYHSLLLPRIFSDASGTYPRFAGGASVEKATGFVYYCDFSLWDTFRSLHPLLTMIDPARTTDMIRSMIAKGQQGGWLPIFPAWNSYTQEMIGDHGAVMIADAYLKGIRGFDVEEAYRLIRRNALETPASYEDYVDGRGRRALAEYMKLGFIPLEQPVKEAFHSGEQVSRTLEYAYDDYVVSELAKALGKSADAELFRSRSMNYRNVIDPQTGFARGRHANGTWDSPFDPAGDYRYITEGLPYQYTFFVPHDVEGLIRLVGGREAFVRKLDGLFDGSHYDHGNEPSHHIAYLYNFAGAPWKTAERVHKVMAKYYREGADGLAGNDDAGQMSAWHVMSAMGLYPVAAGVPVYEIGSPELDRATLRMPDGKTFTIRAAGSGSGKIYIQSAKLNGKPITRTWISHQEIVAGGELVLTMGAEANRTWGTAPEDAPPSATPAR